MKKLINKIGGENKLKSMAAAIWLIRENYQSGSRTTSQLESKFKKLIECNVHLVEEEILVGRFLKEEGEGGIANVTGAGVSTDQPKIDKKAIKKYHAGQASTIAGMIRRPKPVGV